jgi:hypothetical protein
MFVNVLFCKILVGVTLLSQSSNLLSQFSGVVFLVDIKQIILRLGGTSHKPTPTTNFPSQSPTDVLCSCSAAL